MSIIPGGTPEEIMNNNNLGVIDTIQSNVIQFALAIGGGVAIIFIIIGAYHYLTAFGNEERAETGKKTITWAIIGLVFVIFAEFIVHLAWEFMSSGTTKH